MWKRSTAKKQMRDVADTPRVVTVGTNTARLADHHGADYTLKYGTPLVNWAYRGNLPLEL